MRSISSLRRHTYVLLPIHVIMMMIIIIVVFQNTLLSLKVVRLTLLICPTHFSFILSLFSGKPCPAFKLVILDEADSMTPSAQVSLSLY